MSSPLIKLTGKELIMSQPRRNILKRSNKSAARRAVEGHHDFLEVQSAAIRKPNISNRPDHAPWPPVPDLFDVITYFRARGDSFTLIASIGFWVGDERKKALTARGLKLWYEGELERRAAAKATIR